jgi:hypothetical protein
VTLKARLTAPVTHKTTTTLSGKKSG